MTRVGCAVVALGGRGTSSSGSSVKLGLVVGVVGPSGGQAAQEWSRAAWGRGALGQAVAEELLRRAGRAEEVSGKLWPRRSRVGCGRGGLGQYALLLAPKCYGEQLYAVASGPTRLGSGPNARGSDAALLGTTGVAGHGGPNGT